MPCEHICVSCKKLKKVNSFHLCMKDDDWICKPCNKKWGLNTYP